MKFLGQRQLQVYPVIMWVWWMGNSKIPFFQTTYKTKIAWNIHM
jgi:hypothetical protein